MPCCAVEYHVFARHKVWKIYFGGNDLGSENSQMGDIGPLILSCKNVYALDIQLDRLQFTEPRASCISCYFGLLMVQYVYSCTIHNFFFKKSRGYGSFTVLYCVILYSIEIL